MGKNDIVFNTFIKKHNIKVVREILQVQTHSKKLLMIMMKYIC